MSSTINDRIKLVMNKSGMKQIDFANHTGINKNTVSTIMNGKNFGVDNLSKILDSFPNISGEWLLRGKGEMTDTDQDITATNQEVERLRNEIGKYKRRMLTIHEVLEEEGIDLTALFKSASRRAV